MKILYLFFYVGCILLSEHTALPRHLEIELVQENLDFLDVAYNLLANRYSPEQVSALIHTYDELTQAQDPRISINLHRKTKEKKRYFYTKLALIIAVIACTLFLLDYGYQNYYKKEQLPPAKNLACIGLAQQTPQALAACAHEVQHQAIRSPTQQSNNTQTQGLDLSALNQNILSQAVSQSTQAQATEQKSINPQTESLNVQISNRMRIRKTECLYHVSLEKTVIQQIEYAKSIGLDLSSMSTDPLDCPNQIPHDSRNLSRLIAEQLAYAKSIGLEPAS